MKEIKFRGRRTDNGEWVVGYLLITQISGVFILGTTILTKVQKAQSASIRDKLWQYEVDPETVGQFTGLHDKSGKKIWEGDIIYLKHETGLSTWDESKEIVKFEMGGFTCGIYADLDNICDCEVIGNIWENPELLGGGLI
jgi:uncharacterized phage protein (TIGR01671 family)